MVLDAGATNTTIDSNAMYLLGHDLKDSIGLVEIETANGIIETELFEINSICSLGISKFNFQIQVYDFIAHGVFSDYNRLLGLDFLDSYRFCIDTISNYGGNTLNYGVHTILSMRVIYFAFVLRNNKVGVVIMYRNILIYIATVYLVYTI